jgi:hypothetical protein
MIISNLVGGLGNQMFQYACARSISLEYNFPLKFSIDTFGAYNSHNGYELADVFDLNLEIANSEDFSKIIGFWRSNPAIRRALSKKQFSWLASRRFLSEPHFNFWPDLRERAQYGCYLHGYWQSERYFVDSNRYIRNDFTFRRNLNGANLCISNAISQCIAISIHVRRGDYVSDSKTFATHGTCSPLYYHNAIDTLLQRCPGAKLFAFSDDPHWVSQVLRPRYPDMILVDHNKGSESHNDMRLMSMCRHHVIANSSFSWWGAWLNPNPDKIVIAPARWFADGRDSDDVIPESWERM